MKKSIDDNYVENKSAKRVRITMAVLFFIQVILTTFPFIQGETSEGGYDYLTAFEVTVRFQGYPDAASIKLAIICGLFILLPLVSFFFCIFDKKSNVKNFVSAACCVICACLITFGVGTMISIGAVISLILYVIILFFTAQGFQASIMRDK